MAQLYPAMVNSPQTELASAIDAVQTTIPVLDASKLPDAPNLAVIGMDETAETILYTGKSGNTLTGVTRGFQGTAKSWVAGTKVARNFTAYDWNTLLDKLSNMNTITNNLTRGLNLIQTDQPGALDLRVPGRTLVNLLGKDGNCESLTPFTTVGTVELSTAKKISGNNSIKTTASGSSAYVYKDYNYSLDPTKQYILAGWVYIESWTAGILSLRLYDSGGLTNLRYAANADTTKIGSWQFVYVKIPTANTLVGTGFRLLVGAESGSTSVAYFDDIRLYELSISDYNAIGTTYTTPEQIDAFIPYVDGIKHLQGVAVRKYGKNLLPPFTDSAWSVDPAWTINEPYSATLNAPSTTNLVIYCTIPVVAGQTYTISKSGNARMIVKKESGSGATVVSTTSASASFTVDSTYNGYVHVRFDNNNSAGTFTLTNPKLELGSVATPFEPRNDDYVYLPTALASSVDRTVRDVAFYRDGQWRVLRRLVKDEPLTIIGTTATLAQNAAANSAIIVDSATGEVYRLVTTLSGSGKEFIQGGTNNRTITFNAGNVPTAPVATYVRATPVEEVIVGAEGSISLHSGANAVELLEGVVVREKVTPYLSSGTYYINTQHSSAYLKNRAAQIIAVYKNGVKDNVWTLGTSGTANGPATASTASANFDPTAEYTVTYIVLDKYMYTANAIDATCTYPATLGAAVGKNTQDIADIKQEQAAQNWALDYIQAHVENNRMDIDALEATATKRAAQASDTNISTTSEVTIATHTPAAAGNFLIAVYLRVVNSTTTVTVKVEYTDAGGAQTTYLLNAQSMSVGSYSLLPLFINSTAATINVKVTASAANNVKASATILGV